VPVLLVNEGIEVTKSLTYVLLMALLNPFGSLLAMRYADAFQRKWQIVALALVSAVCGILWAQQHKAVGIIILGAVITLANSWFSCALHTYQAELYPTRIRAQAVGFVYSWSRFTSIFASFLIGRALLAYGTTGVFAIVATAMLTVAAVVGIWGPNSTRVRLEVLSR
jgi:MFS transporter, putative metabolite:H+ symporter